MYSVERLLGRLLSSRALILAFVLAIATSIAVVFRYSHWENIFLRRNQTTDDVLDLLEAYAVRVEKSAEATTHSTNPSEPKASAHTAIEPDERFVHQLLISLEQPTVREHISRQLLSQTPDRPIDQTEAKAAEPVKSYTEHESEQSKTATVVHGGNTDQPAPRTSDGSKSTKCR